MYDGDPAHSVVKYEFRATKASVSFATCAIFSGILLTLQFQAAVEHRLLAEVFEMVQANYVQGRAPHRLHTARSKTYDPRVSSIFVTQWASFKAMSAREIQEIFRHRHILVLDAPVEQLNFDRDGLETLGSLHLSRTVQGKLRTFPILYNC
jgi:hypothetical protein